MKRIYFFTVFLSLILTHCISVPSGVHPVQDFNLQRYLGKWYEIARLDHGFERGLSNVSATYTLRKDGGINVLNRGFDKRTGRWKEAIGRAYFVEKNTTGRLKVTFFGPFYGGYNVIALDYRKYSYAMVCGPDRSYLWILARDKTLSSSIIQNLLLFAEELGFNTREMIFVEHDHPNA